MDLLWDELMLQSLNDDFKHRLRDEDQRARIVAALYTWLVNVARKKTLPDIDQRCDAMKLEFKQLVENMEVSITAGKWVVKAAGSSESTLKKLRLGTDWFDGSPDVLEIVLTGLFDV